MRTATFLDRNNIITQFSLNGISREKLLRIGRLLDFFLPRLQLWYLEPDDVSVESMPGADDVSVGGQVRLLFRMSVLSPDRYGLIKRFERPIIAELVLPDHNFVALILHPGRPEAAPDKSQETPLPAQLQRWDGLDAIETYWHLNLLRDHVDSLLYPSWWKRLLGRTKRRLLGYERRDG